MNSVKVHQSWGLEDNGGGWSMVSSGQGSGPPTSSQTEQLCFCLFDTPASMTPFIWCSLKSYETRDFIQHFIDEETGSQEHW